MAKTISDSIAGLTSREMAIRQSAADELFRLGRALADSGVKSWLRDAELAGLFVREAGQLRATVGIAVRRESFAKIHKASGFPHLAEVPPDQDAEEFELHFSGGVRLDILTTKAPLGNGAITRFLEKFGEGIQQVEFVVTNVDRVVELLQTRFSQSPVYPQTRPGADGTRVNFFLVAAPKGRKVLVELVETPRG